MFVTKCIQLACDKCIDEGKATECPHLLHLVPRWQSGERHIRLKTIMEDRPDLIQSELSGLAFDSLQQAFRTQDIEHVFKARDIPIHLEEPIFVVIDPAAGGAQSNYAVISCTRMDGIMRVSVFLCHERMYSCWKL